MFSSSAWRDYRVKAKAQTDEAKARAAEATARKAEADVRLAEVFARLVAVADGRNESSVLSETAVGELLKGVKPLTPADADQFRNRIAPAVLPSLVGVASQVAALALIAELVRQYPDTLSGPGRDGLRALDFVTRSDSKLRDAYQAALERAGVDAA